MTSCTGSWCAGIRVKRALDSCQKSPIILPKDTWLHYELCWLLVCRHSCQKSHIFLPKPPYLSVKRALYYYHKRAIFLPKESVQAFVSKEPTIPAKRALYAYQKSPIFLPNEPHISAQRGCMSGSVVCLIPLAAGVQAFIPKEPYIPTKRALYSCQKSPIFLPKETHIPANRGCMSGSVVCQIPLAAGMQAFIPKKPYIHAIEALYSRQKRPTFLPKEPNISAERDRVQCQVRLAAGMQAFIPKKPYIHAKRALHSRQKRPTFLPKEPYISAKRALYFCRKRPG